MSACVCDRARCFCADAGMCVRAGARTRVRGHKRTEKRDRPLEKAGVNISPTARWRNCICRFYSVGPTRKAAMLTPMGVVLRVVLL